MSAPGTVHVWSADLSSVPSWVPALLDAEERRRAARMIAPVSRERWAAARGLLRVLLSERTGSDPATLQFAIGRHGKPSLANSQIRFNVSHSDDRALYAIASEIEVGVDIEVASRGAGRRRATPRDDLAIAKRVLGEAVAERLETLPEHRRSEEFLRAWVTYEARVKCLGVGLGHALAQGAGEAANADVAAAAGVAAGAGIARPDRNAEAACPWTCELDAGPGAFAALAVQGGPAQVLHADWRP